MYFPLFKKMFKGKPDHTQFLLSNCRKRIRCNYNYVELECSKSTQLIRANPIEWLPHGFPKIA